MDIPPDLIRFAVPKEVDEAFAVTELKTIVLRFSEGRDIWLSKKDFTKTHFIEGYPAYSTVLPSAPEGLRALSSAQE